MSAVLKPHMVIGIDLGMICKWHEGRGDGRREARPAVSDASVYFEPKLDLRLCSACATLSHTLTPSFTLRLLTHDSVLGTGVSYANLSIGSETVRWVQKLPGRFQANENKVPTVVVYPKGNDEPSSWGFLSETAVETTSEDKEYKE